jgi:hypothetical protein
MLDVEAGGRNATLTIVSVDKTGVGAWNLLPMKPRRIWLLIPWLALPALADGNSAPSAASPSAPSAAKAAPKPAPADPEAVEAALKAMHFDESISATLAEQKQAMFARIGRAFGMVKLGVTSTAELVAYEKQAMKAVSAAINLEKIHADIARAFGSVFTTDEMRKIADFYRTPAGQAYAAKQSELKQKIKEVFSAHAAQMTEMILQMKMKFIMEQQAKSGAARAQTQDVVPAAGSR